jgi:two-component system sensor histidine kinase HydH
VLESELRASYPEAAVQVLQQFLENEPRVIAVELRTDARTIAAAGRPDGRAPFEMPLFLGPSWRSAVRFSGGPRAQSPFQIRIWPAAGVGDSSLVAAVVTWGSILVSLALLAFAASAARGERARQEASALDAERQRLELVSAAGAGLAHRIRNPLATIKATAQMLAADAGASGTARERATRIVNGSIRIETLVDDLLQYARPVEAHATNVDLVEAARAIAEDTQAAEAVVVHADPEHVTSAIEELVANARAADPRAPEVVVSRRGRHGVVEVLDRGSGLTIDAASAFEPYVTTRTSGTGLGLAIVRSLVRANGGDVAIRNRDGGGCVATIAFPLAGSATAVST